MSTAIAIIIGVVSTLALIVLLAASLRRSPRLRRMTNRAGWVARCPACGAQTPAGDLGIIRVGATSNPKAIPGRCPACGERTILTIIRAVTAPDPP